MKKKIMKSVKFAPALLVLALGNCTTEPEGLGLAESADITVEMDFFHKPLPNIPLPNDIATRYDETSPTKRRINASMVAHTNFESRLRERLTHVDGWGVLAPITIPFSGPIDIQSVIDRHDDDDYATNDDAIYIINITEGSKNYGAIQHVDLGKGNYPTVLKRQDLYWKNDSRRHTLSLQFEETNEDKNGNGILDPGEDINGNGVLDPGEDLNGNGVLDPPEDSDADGLLDVKNYRPGHNPSMDDLAGRADAIMSFYERQTNTLIARPLVPLEDRTTYAVVVTRRILDTNGNPIGSPYRTINHTAQTEQLKPLLKVLPEGLTTKDIAFTFAFTTQTIREDWVAVRDGLYGHGVQKHFGEEYPAEVAEILPLRDAAKFPGMKKPHLMYGENWRPALETIQQQLVGADPGAELTDLLDGTSNVDYFVVGSYMSPQLFPKNTGDDNASGDPIPLDDRVWPQDLSFKPAPTYPEKIYFTLSVPRKEVSARKDGKPVPIIFLGHGYGGNRFDVLQYSSYFARLGFAVIGIDGPSHGLGLKDSEILLAEALLTSMGLKGAGQALLSDRAVDQNNDGTKDSGADFWSSYILHTRDMVRQFAVDYMQLVRIIDSFDGQRRWAHDTNGDGQPDLAGDFDGDGVLDISLESPLHFFGGSLGGIMGMVMGGVEPRMQSIAPVAGGGGYADIGPRSTQSGVPEAFILRAMGPLIVGTVDPETKDMLIETVVSDLNDDRTYPLATVSDVKPWDTVVVENLNNGERRCAFVDEEGLMRTSIATDLGDSLVIKVFKGPQVLPSEDCQLREGAQPTHVIDKFQYTFNFQGTDFNEGEPLEALMEGLGLRRANPDFRRITGIAQQLLDPSDPAVLAQYWQREPLHFPGTGKTTGTHALIITTMGDTSVPVSSGILVGRASGIVPYLEADPRLGVSANQHYINTYTTEGVNILKRFVNSQGEGIHFDVENFSGGNDLYGAEIPRAQIPLRVGFDKTDLLGGKSAHIVPYTRPSGQHGFDMPGYTTDKAIEQCLAVCTDDPETVNDPCNCSTARTFDIGYFMLNMVGQYFQSGAKVLSADLCQSSNSCDFIPPVPASRPAEELD